MTLLVDVGNSRCKWARLVNGAVVGHHGAAYRQEEFHTVLNGAWKALAPPHRVIACNVGGAGVAQSLSAWVRANWGVECRFLTPRPAACGVTCAYPDPGQLGADRWAKLIAARHRFPGAACIVDCGTAVTVDVLAADGRHAGGMITAGVALMRRSLTENTRGIGPVGSENISMLARNTSDGVASGTLYAVVAFIDRVLDEVSARLAEPPRCLLTGGDAETVRPRLVHETELVPDLVLQGLAVVAETAP